MNIKPFRHCLSGIIFLLFLWFPSFGQLKISLQQAIDSTLKNNLRIQQSMVNEIATKEDVHKAKGSRLPTLNFSSTSSLDFGRSLDPVTYSYQTRATVAVTPNLTSNVVLFQGFQKRKSIEESELMNDASRYNTAKLKNDLVLNVVSTFLSILNYQGQLKAAQEQLEVAREQLIFENQNLKAGKKIIADVTRAKLQISKIEVDVTTAINQLNNSKVDLSQLMNINPDLKLDLIEPAIADVTAKGYQVSDLYRKAVLNFPDIKVAQINYSASVKHLQILKAAFYPSLSFSTGIASGFSYTPGQVPSLFNPIQPPFFYQLHANVYEYISINLFIPIFNDFNNSSAIKKARLNIISAKLNEQTVKNDLYKTINQAASDLEAAKKNYVSALDSYESAKETFKVIQKRYLRGLATSLDFNQAQSEMNQAQLLLIHNKFDLIFRSKVVNFYNGESIKF